jgi:hypothetical protein
MRLQQDAGAKLPDRRVASLDAALEAAGIPLGNRYFVRQVAEMVDISSYILTRKYIKAVRAGSGPSLRIAKGWSDGFVTKQEAERASGGRVLVYQSDRPGLWGVEHPRNWIRSRHGGSEQSRVQREGLGSATGAASRRHTLAPVTALRRSTISSDR